MVEDRNGKIIIEIRDLQNELVFLKVKRELINLSRKSAAELEEILESLKEQLKRRKEFLGGKNGENKP